MSRYTVLYDANVLYPAPLRDILLQIAKSGVIRARWTERIHREWIGNLLADRDDLSRARLERTRARMDESIPDALIINYEEMIASLISVNEKDRHVLAAAIIGRCDGIITLDRKFSAEVIGNYNLDIQTPDEFICNQIALTPDVVCGAVHEIRNRLNPPRSMEKQLETLERQGLTETVRELKKVC